MYLKDKDFGRVYKAIKSGTSDKVKDNSVSKSKVSAKMKQDSILVRDCFIENGRLYRRMGNREVLCVLDAVIGKQDISLRWALYSEYHDNPLAGHRGVGATASALRSRFYWPGLLEDVRKFVSSCDKCQMYKIDRRKAQGKLQPVQVPDSPCQSYNLDFVTDLAPSNPAGHDMILVIIDRFSQRVFAIGGKANYTAAQWGKLFYLTIVCEHCRGIPIELVTDRDSLFTSDHWKSIQSRCGTAIRFSTSRSQSTNGAVERQNAVIEEILSMDLNYNQNNWCDLLPAVLFSINNSVSSALPAGMTPIEVETANRPLLPMDTHAALKRNVGKQSKDIEERMVEITTIHEQVHDAVVSARERMKASADKKRRDPAESISVGQKVWLNLEGIHLNRFNLRPCPKLNPRYYGPFEVVEQPGPLRFRLDLPDDCYIHDVFHVNRLKPYSDPSMVKFKNRKIRLSKEFLDSNRKYEVERFWTMT